MAAVNGPAELVQDKYAKSVGLADAATSAVNSFQQALNNSIYQPPTVSVQWSTLAAPQLPSIPDLPQLPQIALDVPDGMPTPMTAGMVDVTIDDFSVNPPSMDFGQMPELTIGAAPTLPQVRDVAIPDAPDVALPDAPRVSGPANALIWRGGSA